MKRLLFTILLGTAAVAVADGPGSRIRATPAPPQPAGAGPLDKDLQRCEAMSRQQKERCLRALRSAERSVQRAPHEPGPESPGPRANSGTGATSGATGASTGTSGASSAVGGAR